MAEVKLKEETELWDPAEHNNSVEPPHIKEEPELCIKQEPEEFPFHMVSVKTENDEDKCSVLHQRATEENREETNGEDCGAEAGCSSDPLTQLHSDSEEHTDSSSDTDHSEDYSQEQAPSKRSYAMISPDSSVTDVGGTDRPYSCSDCGKRFTRKSSLQRHMSVHTEERPYKCSACEKCFKDKITLKQHIRSHVEDDVGGTDRPYRCSECGKRFRCNAQVQRHMLVHSGARPFKCSVCDNSFKQKYDLTRHLRSQHHFCPVCKKYFADNLNLHEHLRTHVDDGTLDQSSVINSDSSVIEVKPYRCSECGKRFRCNSDLQMHMLIHTGERPYKCSVCEKSFKQKSHVVTHLRVHSGEKQFKCSVCEKAFTEKCNLKRHMRNHTGEKPFVCSVCEEGFKHNFQLTRHLRRLHHICPVCKNHFKDNFILNEHLRTHLEDGINPVSSLSDVRENPKSHRCSECGKRFDCNSALKRHGFSHTGERPFKCSVCEKCFKQKSDLTRHLRGQHHTCPVCKKGFVKKSDLKTHLKTHAEDGTLDQSSEKMQHSLKVRISVIPTSDTKKCP